LIFINKILAESPLQGILAICKGNNMKIYYAFKRKATNFCLSRVKSDGEMRKALARRARFSCMLAA